MMPHLYTLSQQLLNSKMKCKPKDRPYVHSLTLHSSLIIKATKQMYIFSLMSCHVPNFKC